MSQGVLFAIFAFSSSQGIQTWQPLVFLLSQISESLEWIQVVLSHPVVDEVNQLTTHDGLSALVHSAGYLRTQ